MTNIKDELYENNNLIYYEMLRYEIWYSLDKDNNVFLIENVDDLKLAQEKLRKKIKRTLIKKYNILISTIFLYVDHSCDIEDNKPILFETMIFFRNDKDHELDQYQERYSTYKEACDGHRRAVRLVISELRNNEKYNHIRS